MEPRLKKLCADHGIHADVVKWLEDNSCTKMDDVAVHVDKGSELQADVLDHTTQRADRNQRNK